MKKFLFAVAALLCIVGCEYDDTEIKNSIAQLEQRLSAVETVQNAYKNNLFIKSITKIQNGYQIVFSDDSTATILNGTDGNDGVDGKDGKDGIDGINGKDGENGKDGVDGKDGANGKDGADGKDGKDGKDGIDGKDSNTIIESITISDDEVTFVLTDGRTFSIPFLSALSISFDSDDLVVMETLSTRNINFTISSQISDITVEVVSSADIKAKVATINGLTGSIEIKTGATIDEYSKVVLFVSNGEKVAMRSITFEEAGLKVDESATKTVLAEGGEIILEYLTNVECEVVIPEDAQSWISVVPATRAMEKQCTKLAIAENTNNVRSAKVSIISVNGTLKVDYIINQEAYPTENPEPEPAVTSTATIVFANEGLSNAEKVDGNEFKIGEYITAKFEKGGANNATAYYDDGEAIRMYQNGAILNIAASNKTIVAIEFTFAEKHWYLGADKGTLSTENEVRKWTGEAQYVKFTSTGTDKNHRAYIQKIKVTYK